MLFSLERYGDITCSVYMGTMLSHSHVTDPKQSTFQFPQLRDYIVQLHNNYTLSTKFTRYHKLLVNFEKYVQPYFEVESYLSWLRLHCKSFKQTSKASF